MEKTTWGMLVLGTKETKKKEAVREIGRGWEETVLQRSHEQGVLGGTVRRWEDCISVLPLTSSFHLEQGSYHMWTLVFSSTKWGWNTYVISFKNINQPLLFCPELLLAFHLNKMWNLYHGLQSPVCSGCCLFHCISYHFLLCLLTFIRYNDTLYFMFLNLSFVF